MKQCAEVYNMFWNGSLFQWIFYASVVLIILFEKRKYHKLIFGVFPILAIIGILNPLTAHLIGFFFYHVYVYYVRLFSVVPVFYCMAYGLTLLLGKTRGGLKLFGVCAVCGIIILCGRCVYREPWMEKAENLQKTPNALFDVLEVIPRDKENLRVAFPDPLYVYARQADASILMPYGRQLDGGYIRLLGELDNPNPDTVGIMTLAGSEGVDYVVVNNTDEVRAAFSDGGYEPVGQTQGFCVYPVIADIKNVWVLNEKRQLVSRTACDRNGNPTYNNASVLTTVEYDYDDWGNRIQERYYDKDGNRLSTTDGYSGVQRTYSMTGLSWVVDSTTYFDDLDQPLLISGRYHTRYDNNKNNRTVLESYYDRNWQPMRRADTDYAAILKQYDDRKRVISQTYLDVSSRGVVSPDGYVRYTREYDSSNRITSEKYYDIDGLAVDNKAGFAQWLRSYDNEGNVTEELFIDEKGEEVNPKRDIILDGTFDCVSHMQKESVSDSVGVSYHWDATGACNVKGQAQGISWNDVFMDYKPYYLFNGDTYKVQYVSENVYLRISFYEDVSWSREIQPPVVTLEDTEFTVPQNCGAVIVRLWVAPGTSVNETVHPRICLKADGE